MSKAVDKEGPSRCQELSMKVEIGEMPPSSVLLCSQPPLKTLAEPIEKPVVKGVWMKLSQAVSLLG